MQPDASPAQAAKANAHVGRSLSGNELFLDRINLGPDAIGDPVHRVGDLVDDLFQKRRDSFDAMAALRHATGRVHGAQRLMPAADQEALGHRETKKSGLFGCIADFAHEI